MNSSTRREPLVLVSNMFPSDEHPAYGIFVKRSADQLAAHYRICYLVLQKTPRPLARTFRYLVLNLRLSWSLLRHRRTLHMVHFPLYFAPALMLARSSGAPLVVNFHGSDNRLDTPLKRTLGRMLGIAIHHRHVVAPSTEMALPLQRRYPRVALPILVSPSAGVDPQRFYPPPCHRPGVHVGFVGSLLAAKGWQRFLDVMALLTELPETRSWRFSIVGDGPDRQLLGATLKRRGLSAKRWPMLSQAALADHYRSLSVLVFPSDHESLGLVPIEALACGVPVVAHDIDGPAGYITSGLNGTLVAPGDAVAMADAVLQLGRLSASARHRLSQSCARSVDTYHCDRVEAGLRAFLVSASQASRRPSLVANLPPTPD